jgi:hypothetical protein
MDYVPVFELDDLEVGEAREGGVYLGGYVVIWIVEGGQAGEEGTVVMSRLDKFIPRSRHVRYSYARCHVREVLYVPLQLTLLYYASPNLRFDGLNRTPIILRDGMSGHSPLRLTRRSFSAWPYEERNRRHGRVPFGLREDCGRQWMHRGRRGSRLIREKSEEVYQLQHG